MPDVIAIRGVGLITALGGDVASTWESLLAGGAIRDHARARIELASDAPRVHQLASHAARQAVAQAGYSAVTLRDSRTALVAATSKGPADDWLAGAITGSFGLASLAEAIAHDLGHAAGPRLLLSGACAGGLHALIRAALLIEHDDADRAIVVAAESSLHPLFLQSFRRLGVLPPPGEVCRPFDQLRAGFRVAEAAAAVIIERAAPQPGQLCIDRYAFAGDASHLTGSTGDTLRRMLAVATGGRAVDVIHAHGTGTEANDAAEAAAIDAVLAELRLPASPTIFSHKGALGHTLGAAGLVAIVLNSEMHRTQLVPSIAGLRDPLPIRHAALATSAISRAVRRSVAVASGFGGATAALSLTQDE